MVTFDAEVEKFAWGRRILPIHRFKAADHFKWSKKSFSEAAYALAKEMVCKYPETQKRQIAFCYERLVWGKSSQVQTTEI